MTENIAWFIAGGLLLYSVAATLLVAKLQRREKDLKARIAKQRTAIQHLADSLRALRESRRGEQ